MTSTAVSATASPNPLTALRRSGAGPYLFVVALTIVMFFVLGPRQFVNALTIGAIYALVALGYTMVYGIIELINFAHGDVFMVGAFVSLFVLTNVLGQTGSATSLEQIVFELTVDVRHDDGRRWASSASSSSGSPTVRSGMPRAWRR